MKRDGFPLSVPFRFGFGCLALVSVMIILFCRTSPDDFTFYEKEDVYITGGDELLHFQTGGPPVKHEGRNVFSVEADKKYSFESEFPDGAFSLALVIQELNCRGIPAILYCGSDTEGRPMYLTRGHNKFTVEQTEGQGRHFELILLPDERTTFRLSKIVFLREGAHKSFPWNLLIVLLTVYCTAFFTLCREGSACEKSSSSERSSSSGRGSAFERKSVDERTSISGRSNVYERKKQVLIFVLCFLLFMMQMRNTWYSFDDYGYLSLSYRQLTDNRGMAGNPLKVLEFLCCHYLKWGGRVTAFLLEITVGRNIWVFRIAQSALLSGLCSCCGGMSLVILCFTDLAVQSDGAWWYTASVLYLWPVFFTMAGLKLFFENRRREGHAAAKLLSCIMIFSAASSQEQVSAAVLVMALIYICLIVKKPHIKARRLREEGAETGGQKNGRHAAGFLYCRAFFACLFAGSLFLFASPGSRERLFEAQRDSPAENFGLLVRSLCSDQMRFYIFLLLTAGMVSAAWLLVSCYKEKDILHCNVKQDVLHCSGKQGVVRCNGKQDIVHCSGEQDGESRHGAGFPVKRRFRISVLVFGISATVFAAAASGILLTGGGLTAVYQRMLRLLGLEKLNPLGEMLLPVMLFAALSEMMLVLIKKRSVVSFVYAIGALVSFLCILPSPGFSSRMLLPSALFMIPSLNTVLKMLLSVRKKANDMANDRISSFAAIASPALLAVLLSAGGMNQNSIMEGYYRNSESEEYNVSVLENYDSNKDENGLVTLKKHWDDSYGNMMPYMEGYEWIEGYMKTMYDLPEDAVFRWEGEDYG